MNILVIEDNEPERIIMREAFKEAGVECDLYMVRDGIEAFEFLNREGTYETVPRPNLIILDLNLPRKNGREVLAELKSAPQWEHIPILVLSNSESPRDIGHRYACRANAYINKPSDFQKFIDLVHAINLFWLQTVRYSP
jgi:chemotaxis family two-component system response regulator Rcp1